MVRVNSWYWHCKSKIYNFIPWALLHYRLAPDVFLPIVFVLRTRAHVGLNILSVTFKFLCINSLVRKMNNYELANRVSIHFMYTSTSLVALRPTQPPFEGQEGVMTGAWRWPLTTPQYQNENYWGFVPFLIWIFITCCLGIGNVIFALFLCA
jgi:hypothetical protein